MAIFRIQRDLTARDFDLVPSSFGMEFDDEGFSVTGRNQRGQKVEIVYEGSFSVDPRNPQDITSISGEIERFEIGIANKLVLSIRNLDISFAFGGSFADYSGFLAGNDVISGSRKANDLFGFGGNDRLKGGGGRDELDGGAGRDLLIGGKGADDFIFGAGAGRDKVKDFVAGLDDLVFETTEAFADLTIRDVRNGVLITHDGGKVLLIGVEADDLSNGDFLFA
ncbi:MAG: hypothetical protein VYD87_06630 [Pseudomonadota bacterium]|nr:hypothetical protein [Pseudomonadota bacterium]